MDVGGGTRGEVLAEGAKAQGLGRRVGRWEKEGEREREVIDPGCAELQDSYRAVAGRQPPRALRVCVCVRLS